MLLAFDDDGPGPVVVLLHGFPFDRSMWSHQRSSVGAIYRVIAFDLRGHGTTAAPDGIYTVDEMADDVIETLDALQLTGPVVVGGHSMGGYLALSIACRYPGRVGGLILVNSRAAADTPEAARARLDLAERVEASGDVEPVVAAMLPRVFARSTFERQPELVARMHQRMVRTPARAVAGTLRGLAARPDRREALGSLAMPTLVLAGSEDQLIPFEESEEMARGLPNGAILAVPGTGHVAPLENPSATDEAILAFLRSSW